MDDERDGQGAPTGHVQPFRDGGPPAADRGHPADRGLAEDPDQRLRDLENLARSRGDRLAALAEIADRRREQIDTLKARNRAAQAANADLRARPAARLLRRTASISRAGLALASRAEGAGRDAIGRLGIGWSGWHRLRATEPEEDALIADIRRILPSAPGPSGTTVGVVIVGGERDRVELLRRRIDESQARVTEVRFVPDEPGRLAEAASDLEGDAVLLMSGALEPIEEGWLRRMVGALDASGADIIGALIVHGRRRGPLMGRADEAADLRVRQLGVRFEPGQGGLLPRFAAWGEDPRVLVAGPRLAEVAAVDACLLVSRATLDAVGGVASSQVLDRADVDLSLRVRAAGGRVAVAAEAVLLDRGPGGGPGPMAEVALRLSRSWTPYLFREVLRDRLTGRGTWSRSPVRAVLVPPVDGTGQWSDATLRGLAECLRATGWRVRLGSPSAGTEAADGPDDLVLVPGAAVPDIGGCPDAIRIGLVAGAVPPGGPAVPPDDLDLVVHAHPAGSEEMASGGTTAAPGVAGGEARGQPGELSTAGLAREIGEALLRWIDSPRFTLVLGADTAERARTWGDWHFAGGLRRELERRGVPSVVVARGDAASLRAARSDASLALFGSATHETRPGQLNALWIISHPDRLTRAVCDRFDLIFAASDTYAADLGRRLGRLVRPLHQATDPERFHPDPSGPRHQLLFVGNSRGVRRPILDMLRDTPHELAVYGRNWAPELLDAKRLRGEWVPNDELARYYSSADIVLSDHWPDMRDEGFIANRVYDAAAAEAFVISDDVPGLAAEFDGGVVSYRDADDLRALVDRFLADPISRAAHARAARRAVLARHTFAARADEILGVMLPLLRERSAPRRGGGTNE